MKKLIWIVSIVLGCLFLVTLLCIQGCGSDATNDPPKESLDSSKAIRLTEMMKREWEPHGAKVLLGNTESSCFVLRAPYFPLGNNIELGEWPKEQLFNFPPDTPPTSSQFSLWQQKNRGQQVEKEKIIKAFLLIAKCVKACEKKAGKKCGRRCKKRCKKKCEDENALEIISLLAVNEGIMSTPKKNEKAKEKCRTECEEKQGKKCKKKCKKECKEKCDNEKATDAQSSEEKDKKPPQPPPKDGTTIVNGVQWATCLAANPPPFGQRSPNPHYNPRKPTSCLIRLQFWKQGGKLHVNSTLASLRTAEECVEPDRLEKEEYEPSEGVKKFANALKIPIKLDSIPLPINAPYLRNGIAPKDGGIITVRSGRSTSFLWSILLLIIGLAIGLRWQYISEFVSKIKNTTKKN